MAKINLKSNNRLFSIITFILILSLIAYPIFSYLVLYLLPHLSIKKYLVHNIYYIIFIIPIALYFLIARLNYYTLKIDSYVIDIKVYRTGVLSIFGFYYPKDFIDISHEMFENFTFYNRPYSFNKTLMINIKKENGTIKKKRFNLSFITQKEQRRISKVLEKIIAKNS
tara:strand:+ start:87 stop:590 length:504 start_codon:yes stop_codon:yes gene_type:complete